MDKKAVMKFVMMGLGAALSIGASLVNGKNQSDQMKETIAKEVADQLANQAKES